MLLLIPKHCNIRRELNIFDVDNEINILPSFIHNIYFKEGTTGEFAVCEDRDGCLYKVETKSVYDTLAIKVKEVDSIYDKKENLFQIVEITNKDMSKLYTKPVIKDIIVNDPKYANRMTCVFKYVDIKLSQQNEFLNDLKFLCDNSVYSDSIGMAIAEGDYKKWFININMLIEILEKAECSNIYINRMDFFFNNGCGKRLFKKIDEICNKYNICNSNIQYFKRTKVVKLNRKEPTLVEQVALRIKKSRHEKSNR